MYNYEWDKETGGYVLLPTKISGVTKELRPVFAEELRFLGFDKDFGWKIPDSADPLMWAENRRYFYRGEQVAEVVGGGLYTKPTFQNIVSDLSIVPVDIPGFLRKNESIMNGLVQRTLKNVYSIFEKYRDKVDMSYVAFSGGKDSVVMLDIVQRALPHDKFEVIFGDTTMELRDTYKNVEIAEKFWADLKFHAARADFKAVDSWKFIGPPARTIRWCCGVHKSVPSLIEIKKIIAGKRKCAPTDIKNYKVLAFTGVRREESISRSAYDMVSDGGKHTAQISCHPILEWSSGELFLYIYAHNLPIHQGYRYGLHRVGCILCPMSTIWSDFIQNNIYGDEVLPYLNIIRDGININFATEKEWREYAEFGGWKKRAGGKILSAGENRVTFLTEGDKDIYILRNVEHSWTKWMATLGDFVEVREGVFSLQYGDTSVEFGVREESDGKIIVSMNKPENTKENIRFKYLFKNVLYKTAYCKNCKECMVDCPRGALTITTDDIVVRNCVHCGRCLDRQKGCVVARSVAVGGGNNMNIRNVDRYKTFGFRKEWLDLYLAMPDKFWEKDRLGVDMFYAFDKWAREIKLITDKKTSSEYIDAMIKLGADSPILWGYFFVNMAYDSPVVNRFVRSANFGVAYSNDELMAMLGDELKERTRRNAITSLKDTLKSSPIGDLLGQGQLETKGRSIVSVTRTGWREPEPLVILYSLYMFAEKMDKMYSFTLSDLSDDDDEREGLSPGIIFGIPDENLKKILQGLANTYRDHIRVDFNKGIMENIDLPAGKAGTRAEEILSLI